jgi:hypothetical protein
MLAAFFILAAVLGAGGGAAWTSEPTVGAFSAIPRSLLSGGGTITLAGGVE